MSDKVKTCPFCGEEILEVAVKCKHCGEWLDRDNVDLQRKQCPFCGEDIALDDEICVHCGEKIGYRSDTSSNLELPEELKCYNWCPLFGSIFWGYFNGMPKNILVTFLILWLIGLLIPEMVFYAGIAIWILKIWAGTKGNQWAWNYKKWNSVEEFIKCQTTWAIILFIFWLPSAIYLYGNLK